MAQIRIFKWGTEAFDFNKLDDDSKEMAFSRGIPEILLLRFLDEPKSCCDASTGNRLTIFAEHRGVFYQLALDEDGRVWSIGLGDRSAFVNSSLGKFARFAYAVIEPNKNFDDAENRGDIAEFQRQVVLLRNRMQEIDPAFLEHEHSWWAGYLAGI